ncbi:MAG: serine/threonine-protein kinase [Planctomycetota bacterium]
MSQTQFPFLNPSRCEGELGTVGRFGIRRLLGQGGMGYVFEAFDRRLERSVALKVIKPELAQRQENLDRFVREAKILAAIRHRNVVTIFEVGVEGRYPFLAMELLSGMTLAERSWQGPIETAESLRLVEEICQGLEAAHRVGVIHRDIKPSNLWLDPVDHGVRLLDFGLAYDRHLRATEEELIAGTLHYLSPEQASGDPITTRSDLYSVGVTLYELLARRLPHNETTSAKQLAAIVARSPEPLHTLNATLPQSLYDLVGRLLAKSPTARPATAGEVAQDLRSIRETLLSQGSGRIDATLVVPKIETVDSVVPNRRRLKPWMFSFLGVIILLGCVAGWMASISSEGAGGSLFGTGERVATRRSSDSTQRPETTPAAVSRAVVRPMLEPLPHRNAITNFNLAPEKVRADLLLRNRPGRSREQSLPLLRFEIDTSKIDTSATARVEFSFQPRRRGETIRLDPIRVLTVGRRIEYGMLANMSWKEWLRLRQTSDVEVLGVVSETVVSEGQPRARFSSPSLLRSLRDLGTKNGERAVILLLEQVERSQDTTTIHCDPAVPELQPTLEIVTFDGASDDG